MHINIVTVLRTVRTKPKWQCNYQLGLQLGLYGSLCCNVWCWHFLHNSLHSFPWPTVSILCRNNASALSLFHCTHFTSSPRPQNISHAKTAHQLRSSIEVISGRCTVTLSASKTVRTFLHSDARQIILSAYVHTNLTLQWNLLYEKQISKMLANVSKVAKNVCKKRARILRGPQTKVSTSSFYLPKSCHPLPEIRNNRVILMILEGYGSNLAFLLGTIPASA